MVRGYKSKLIISVIIFLIMLAIICVFIKSYLTPQTTKKNEVPQVSEGIKKEEDISVQNMHRVEGENIIFNTVPKSGSVYITTALKNGLGYDYKGISPSYFPHDNIACEKFKEFSHKSSQITQQHMDASVFNLQLLRKFSPKVVVHFRDPRQVLLSWVHQLNKHKNSEYDILLYYIAPTPPEEYYTWTLSKQIDWNIENFLPEVVSWMEGWLDLYQLHLNTSNDVKILITTYDEFVADEIAFYNRILKFYNIDTTKFRFSPPKKDQDVHYRNGDSNEWKEVFSDEQKKIILSKIPIDILNRFGWEL